MRDDAKSIVAVICEKNHQDSDDCKNDVKGHVGVDQLIRIGNVGVLDAELSELLRGNDVGSQVS